MNRKRSKVYISLGLVWLLTAVGLIIWQLQQPATITIQWRTVTEQNTAGFQLYRSHYPDRDFQLISDQIIPSQGTALSGHTYHYTDAHTAANQTYYYLLEEIEYNGRATRHTDDIFSSQATTFTPVSLATITLVALVGLGFVAIGVKRSVPTT